MSYGFGYGSPWFLLDSSMRLLDVVSPHLAVGG
jgi:hypothetical protein